MKLRLLNRVALSVIAALALASCGGSNDDEAGSTTTLSIVPTDWTAAGDGTVCPAGRVQTVYIYGGVAPYRIDNTKPAALAVDKTSVDSRGGSFTVTTVNNYCIDPASVVVVDKLERIVTLTVHVTLGAATTP